MPTLYVVHCVAAHPACPRLAFGDAAGIVSVVDVHGLEWGDTEARSAVAASAQPEAASAPRTAQRPSASFANDD